MFDHAVLNPIAVTMNAVPVTPGGLGVTEGAFAYLAQAAGSDNGALIALISRMIQYAVFLPGTRGPQSWARVTSFSLICFLTIFIVTDNSCRVSCIGISFGSLVLGS